MPSDFGAARNRDNSSSGRNDTAVRNCTFGTLHYRRCCTLLVSSLRSAYPSGTISSPGTCATTSISISATVTVGDTTRPFTRAGSLDRSAAGSRLALHDRILPLIYYNGIVPGRGGPHR